ncbi:MAG: hypothetical protein IKS64_02470 [Muribaculaceae bacterium]|nr:hypothetical protein [Muribaculaceae bacterium]
MKRIITLVVLLLCSAVWMMALDVVRLTDGRVIKGRVVTQVAGESVTIENQEGVVVTYPSYLVKSVTIGEVRDAAQDNADCRGFRALVDAGAAYAFSDSRGSWFYTASATAGYQMNRLLFVGAGLEPSLLTHSRKSHCVETRDDKDVFLMPIYAMVRFENMYKPVSPFAEVRLGGNFLSECKGIFFRMGFGFRIHQFSVSANYSLQGAAYYPFYVFTSGRDYISSAGIKLGYEF